MCIGLAACGGRSTTPAPADDETPTTAAPTEEVETTADSDPSRHWSSEELSRLVEHLASDTLEGREEGSPGGVAARRFLLGELTRCGIAPLGESHEQAITTGKGVNVLGFIRGSDDGLRDRHIIVGAHYDHIGACGGAICNGANDNAAAVAITLGVGCALAETPPRKSVVIALWDAEEPPTFLTDAMGSEFYAANPRLPLSTLDVALALDLLGADFWPGFGAHVVLGAELSAELRRIVAATPVPEGLTVLRMGLHLAEEQPTGHRQAWSDYDPFRDRGLPILFLSGGQNKRYHTALDEVKHLSVPKMVREAAYVHGLVRALADSAAVPVFDHDGTDYRNDAFAVEAMLDRALGPGGLVEAYSLSDQSRQTLTDDLAAARVIVARVEREPGAELSVEEVRHLRDGVQHVMCMAGTYPESACNLF